MKVYVCFHSALGNPWWSKFCDKEFTHCFMIKEQLIEGIPIYIRLESLTRVLINDVFLGDIIGTINMLKAQKRELRVLVGEYEFFQPESYNQLVHLNCASVVKKSLGINDPLMITPKQLYKHLKKLGYREI